MKILSLSLLFLLFSCAQNAQKQTRLHSTDTHMQIHPSSEAEDMKFHGARALFAANSIDIQRVIVVSNSYSKMSYLDYARSQNSFVAREAKKNPSKIAGACSINPLMEWARDEMRRCKQDGLKVLKLHTVASGMNLRKEADLLEFKKILALAQELKFTVLIHGNYPKETRGREVEVVLKTLEEFPSIRFIIGHLLGREFPALTHFKHPNFLVEVSVVPIWLTKPEEQAHLVKVMEEVGIKKFVFGSDWPVYHPAELLNALQQLPLTSLQLDQIVYENSKALDDLFTF